jgi:hypothetical protein
MGVRRCWRGVAAAVMIESNGYKQLWRYCVDGTVATGCGFVME